MKKNGKASGSRVRIYYDRDAEIKNIRNKTVAVLGFGSQGRAQAMNLRKSGVKVIVSASKPGSRGWEMAKKAGFKPLPADQAARKADVVHMLVPDEQAKPIYDRSVRPYLRPGMSLSFSHGFNIHFRQIVPPADVDVWMVAPKGPGHMVREEFEAGRGVPALVAIQQDATGTALKTALGYAKAIGATRPGVIGTTFRDETETDLFGEQSVLCGGASHLILAGYETLVKAGYPPELAYFEVLHEMKLICDLLYRGGFTFMRYSISNTAEYGDYSRGPRVVGAPARKAMVKILKEIQSGAFAREWVAEWRSGGKKFFKYRKASENHSIEKVGARLRSMMPWIRVPQG